MKKRIVSLCLAMLLFALTGCGAPGETKNHKLKIVTTLFPQYDFARQIAGEYADVRLLLPPGTESHSYEPSPSDMIAINKADLFIYTGDAMEGWVSGILNSIEGDPVVLDLSLFIKDFKGQSDSHRHDIDPHVFTNPRYAMDIATAISGAISKLDPEHYNVYEMNGTALHQSLAALDQSFRTVVGNATRNKLIFGSRFPFLYFVEEYALNYDAAYDSCSSETEPAASDVARLVDTVREEKIPVVFYDEQSGPEIAKLICEETGAKPLLFHSCHNVSKEEFKNGATYISLMRTNVEHLKEALSQ